MSRKDTFANTTSQTDWARLEAMTDADIDFSDIPELTDAQLEQMRPTEEVIPAFARSAKKRITIRLDSDIIDSFKQQAQERETSYQTLINAVLRDFVARNHREYGLRTVIREIVREELARAG